MTEQPMPILPLTDRDRLRALYGEPAERPDVLAPFEERVQRLLDISDRLIAGAKEIRR